MICGVYAVLGAYLIAAARNPSENRSLISFTIWSSVVHAGIMAVQATCDGHEMGHLVGDVPALLLVAAAAGLSTVMPVWAGALIVGFANLPARVPADASALYARNVLNFLSLSLNPKTGEFAVPKDDEIIKATLVCENGAVVSRG